jgi:hypothetical protein
MQNQRHLTQEALSEFVNIYCEAHPTIDLIMMISLGMTLSGDKSTKALAIALHEALYIDIDFPIILSQKQR